MHNKFGDAHLDLCKGFWREGDVARSEERRPFVHTWRIAANEFAGRERPLSTLEEDVFETGL